MLAGKRDIQFALESSLCESIMISARTVMQRMACVLALHKISNWKIGETPPVLAYGSIFPRTPQTYGSVHSIRMAAGIPHLHFTDNSIYMPNNVARTPMITGIILKQISAICKRRLLSLPTCPSGDDGNSRYKVLVLQNFGLPRDGQSAGPMRMETLFWLIRMTLF